MKRINNEKSKSLFLNFNAFFKVRSIISAIVDAILDGDRKRRSEVVGNKDSDSFICMRLFMLSRIYC
jgi:hypothetical protein